MGRKIVDAFYLICILFLIIFWIMAFSNALEPHQNFAKLCAALAWMYALVLIIDLSFFKPNSKS